MVTRDLPPLLRRLEGGLIVSCQAPAGHPLHGPYHIAAMARAVAAGGAVGVRVNGEKDIRAVRAATDLPIIGIRKNYHDGFSVYITPTFSDARIIARAGAHCIAVDATARPRPGGEQLRDLIARIHDELRLPVMADVATFDEGLAAVEYGADLVATTLSGYTASSPASDEPDFDLLRRLSRSLPVPVVAEGRIKTPAQAVEALRLGAFAVVIGRAITDPLTLTKSFVRALREGS